MKLTPRKDLILMTDLFAACIESKMLPAIGSACHRMARRLVANSGWVPKRKRMRMPKRKERTLNVYIKVVKP